MLILVILELYYCFKMVNRLNYRRIRIQGMKRKVKGLKLQAERFLKGVLMATSGLPEASVISATRFPQVISQSRW